MGADIKENLTERDTPFGMAESQRWGLRFKYLSVFRRHEEDIAIGEGISNRT